MKKQIGRTLVLFIILFICVDATAQDSLKIRIRNEAQKHFVEKNYAAALPLYRELLKSYPRQPDYLYGAGVCLAKLNQDQDEAINYLREASGANYDPMAWYYFGYVLHRNFSFDEAIKAYSKFLVNGKSADIKSLDIERQIEMAKNGMDLTQTGHSVILLNTRTILVDQMSLAADINGSGKLMKKPLEFSSKPDLKAGYRPWMFLPVYTEINEYAYFSGYEKAGKNQKQLFRIKNMNHETWGSPEPLNISINTPYDEEYPYFDPKASVLYFSSKGHSSMGGYDIFKSVYDWNTKTWSKPVNLGFPINSPYDDFLYITDEFNHSASFVSTRNTGPGQVTVYRIKLDQDTTGIRFTNVDEIRKASQLLMEPDVHTSGAETENLVAPKPDIQVSYASAVLPVENPAPSESEYNIILAEALRLQLKADSLSRITRDKRLLAKETPDNELKKQLVSEIILSDKEAKMSQREAEKKFAEARKLKTDNYVDASQPDSVVTLAAEINGIGVYQYKTNSTVQPDLPEDKPEETKILKDEFALLGQSPYGESNPIPQGLGIHSGLVYRIQMGVFSKIKPNDAFGGITPIVYEQVNGGSMLKYYAGLFYSMNAVTRALEKVRLHGFPDAFVVAFLDGKLISTEKAREVEFAGYKL